jgi:hypothetical protein
MIQSYVLVHTVLSLVVRMLLLPHNLVLDFNSDIISL